MIRVRKDNVLIVFFHFLTAASLIFLSTEHFTLTEHLVYLKQTTIEFPPFPIYDESVHIDLIVRINLA